jgi:hypothetical protein
MFPSEALRTSSLKPMVDGRIKKLCDTLSSNNFSDQRLNFYRYFSYKQQGVIYHGH